MRIKKIILLLIFIPAILKATPLFSPTWGFSLDLPGDYTLVEGDGRDRFSFTTPDGAFLDIVIYLSQTHYAAISEMTLDVQRRLQSTGDISAFEYSGKEAAILELIFPNPMDNGRSTMAGWGVALELDIDQAGRKPFLIALAYGPAQREDLFILHLSVLDSFASVYEDRRSPGPITVFSYPQETRRRVPIYGIGEETWFYLEDEEANQSVIDREFYILQRYADADFWDLAWMRYYRTIYRDSYSRLNDAAFVLQRKMNTPLNDLVFANRVLEWVQSFKFERDLSGSDFINMVSAVRDGRGDCDNLAMLWAIMLNQANIQAAMMVSREYSHAMGLIDIPGQGARFNFVEIDWLVAETTAKVKLGLIAQDVSNVNHWIGIIFD